MSNRELPMMPWYPDQFAAATSTWRFAERAAYRALLDVQWAIGLLPEDPARLAHGIGMELPEFEAVWPVVRGKFERIEGGLQNFRLEQHRLAAMRRKRGQQSAAEATNAKRYADRDGERPAQRLAKRGPSDTLSASVSASPPSPSPSPSVGEDPSDFPQSGKDGLPDGTPRQRGTNPRALGTNPRANGTNPRAIRNRSLEGWRDITALIDEVAKSPSNAPLTWQYVIEQCSDRIAVRAAEKVGFRQIADRDKFTTSDLQARFREAYEQQLEQSRSDNQPPVLHG